jgi:hypothetical protein
MIAQSHEIVAVLPWAMSPCLALALACTPPAEPEPAKAEPAKAEPATPEPATPEPTAAKAEPAKAEPAKAEPAKAEPATPEPTTPALLPPLTLRTVAVRQGAITLLRQRDAPLVVIDGEPVTWVDDAFVRHPTGSKGLWTSRLPKDHDRSLTIAAVSLEPLGAWTSTEHEIPRFNSYYEVYERSGDTWRQQPLRDGPIVAYYTAFVERDGALLALRSWASDADEANELERIDEPDEDSEARRAKLDRALEQAKQVFVRIAGDEAVVAPEIPAGTRVRGDVTTTSDGTIVAFASERAGESESSKTIALAWRPGQAKPERIEVPDEEQLQASSLSSSGEWVLFGGTTHEDDAPSMESYLVVGRPGGEWPRVPVSLSGRSAPEMQTYVSGAARLSDGELWIAISDPYADGEGSTGAGGGQVVWRKPVEGQWQPVPLPKLRDDASGQEHEPYHATALFSTSDAVWIVVGAGAAYDSSEKVPTLSAVLTTRPGAAPPTVLPSEAQLRRERSARARSSPRKP